MIEFKDLQPESYLVTGQPYRLNSEWIHINRLPGYNPMRLKRQNEWRVEKGISSYGSVWYEYLTTNGDWVEDDAENIAVFSTPQLALEAYNKTLQ